VTVCERQFAIRSPDKKIKHLLIAALLSWPLLYVPLAITRMTMRMTSERRRWWACDCGSGCGCGCGCVPVYGLMVDGSWYLVEGCRSPDTDRNNTHTQAHTRCINTHCSLPPPTPWDATPTHDWNCWLRLVVALCCVAYESSLGFRWPPKKSGLLLPLPLDLSRFPAWNLSTFLHNKKKDSKINYLLNHP